MLCSVRRFGTLEVTSLLAAKTGNTEMYYIIDVNSSLADDPERGTGCASAHEILVKLWL